MVKIFLLIASLFAASARAASDRYHLAVLGRSLAPNAGGQEAYSLKLATNDWELSTFLNNYLVVGSLPMMGVNYDWRFPICDDRCFWQFYFAAGGGISNAGPIIDLTWSAIIPILPMWLPTRAPPYYPALRIDFTTQIILIQWRGVTWSYPLWVGISLPF